MSAVAEVKHVMAVMDDTGDTKVIWDPENQDEVDNAKQTFNNLKGKGYLAYKVIGKGDKGEVIDRFDRHLEKIIMSPPMKGG